MANLYSDQYKQAYVDVPSTKVKPGDESGEKKIMYFSFTAPSVPPSLNDVYLLGKLFKGSRITNVVLQTPDLGTVGAVTVGLDAGELGLETLSANAFLTSCDVHTAADTNSMQQQMEAGGSNSGFLKELLDNVNITLTVSAAWDATSGFVQGYVEYVTI